MPRRRLCQVYGCPNTVERGTLCDQHRNRKRIPTQKSAHERGYDHRWRRLAKLWLAKHPLCAHCLAKTPPMVVPAELVDHVVPLRANGARLDTSNLQSLCRSCHAVKTREDELKYANC